MNGKGDKHNQQVSNHKEIWHKLETHWVRLHHKRLCRCLCGIVDCAVDNLVFFLSHNIEVDRFYWLWHDVPRYLRVTGVVTFFGNASTARRGIPAACMASFKASAVA